MPSFAYISPKSICERSVLGGALFSLMIPLLFLDLACIILRGISYSTISNWAQNETVLNLLVRLQAALLSSIMWFCLQICLIVDLILCMCLADRDFQEGSARTYGIVAIWQAPLVALYLMYELGTENQNWLIEACVVTGYSLDCNAWWSTIRLTSIVPSAISAIFHLITFALAFEYSKKETL
ncbi:hypothetical protein T439DRAFT_365841, partial [Meredithblackwellia eburnea MCA 4105]